MFMLSYSAWAALSGDSFEEFIALNVEKENVKWLGNSIYVRMRWWRAEESPRNVSDLI